MMEENKNYVIIDDVIPKGYQDAIEDSLMGVQLNWNYIHDVTGGIHTNVENPSPAFQHHLFQHPELYENQNGYVDTYHSFFMPMLFCAAEKIGYKVSQIYNGRAFLQTSLEKRKDVSIDPWHIDIPVPHTVMLYYVVDNEACTVLSEKIWKGGDDPQLIEPKDMEDFDYIKVQPKKGRMLIFNGHMFHTAETAKGKTRCIVNYDMALN